VKPEDRHYLADQPTRVESHIRFTRDDDLPRYTSTLFLKGQEYGETPERTTSMLYLDPPQFKVAICFRGVKGSGVGRNKKVAGHLAAKEVCHKLNLLI
jgi:hypothetical protein